MRRFSLFAFVLLCSAAVACGSGSPQTGGRMQVVTTTPLLAEFASTVAGDRLDVSAIIPPGVDLHSFDPPPEVARRIAGADLLIVNGYRLEESLLNVVAQNRRAGVPLAVAASGITPLEGGHDHGESHAEIEAAAEALEAIDHAIHGFEGGDLSAEEVLEEIDEVIHALPRDAHDATIEAIEALIQDYEAGRITAEDAIEAMEEILHGPPAPADGAIDALAYAEGDPHLWLSVPNAVRYVENIRDALVALDPEGAEGYRQRASAFIEDLRGLDAEVREIVAQIPTDRRKIVVFHDAYQYFAHEYGFELAAAVLPASPSQQASAQRVAEVIGIVRSLEVAAVYREPEFSPQTLELIAGETGARVLVLYSASTRDVATYAEMMRANAQALLEGLGGR